MSGAFFGAGALVFDSALKMSTIKSVQRAPLQFPNVPKLRAHRVDGRLLLRSQSLLFVLLSLLSRSKLLSAFDFFDPLIPAHFSLSHKCCADRSDHFYIRRAYLAELSRELCQEGPLPHLPDLPEFITDFLDGLLLLLSE